VVRRAGAGNDDGVSSTDFVGEATTELYGSDPEAFTERRSVLAAQARAAGDRPAAKEIAGLRKPTRPAWMINQLIRADPGVAGRLVELGDELRAAAVALDGAKIRELSQARRRLVDTLIREALQQAGEESPSAALREDLTATFGAALADPQVARELAAGTLLRPVHRADFSLGLPGLALVPPPANAPAGPAEAAVVPEAEEAEEAGEGVPVAGRPQATGSQAARRAGKAGKAGKAQPVKAADRPKAAGGAKTAGEARVAAEAKAAREAKAAAEAKAAEKARAAEQRRQAIADAEQVAAEAGRAADQAAQDERDGQDKVWGLEDQLDEARRRLSATRRRVRETQTAQQKARRALSRLKDTGR
jgi:hypothetical protein